MSAIRNAKRRPMLLAVLAAVVLLSTTAYAAVGAAAKPGITVQISPASQSVVRGSVASYNVTLSSTGSFVGSVGLSASGLPSGSTAQFVPATTPILTGTGSTATSALSVTTTSSTPVGSYTLTVTGTSGKVSGSVTAGLTVNYPLSGSLSMSATPASVTLGAGSTAVYAIQLVWTNGGGDVALSVLGGLPTGAKATFSPNPATGNSYSSTLQVTTTASTPDSTNTLYLVASGKDTGNVTRYAYASVQLVISTSGSPFTISGNLVGLLVPGSMLPLELSLTNPNKKSLSVTNLSVTVQSVTRTSLAIAQHQPCLIGDYAVVQYSGPYPLVVPGSSTKPLTLSQLGVASSNQWPQIKFLNTTSNQDGCKGATLSLSYSGSGTGN